jgi:hypothetical protein
MAAFPSLVGTIAHPEPGSYIDKFLRGGDDVADVIDPDLIEHAQEFFKENGLAIITALFHAALPEAYLGKRGVQVLDLTGGLVTDWTRRIHETGQFLINVLSPDPDLIRVSNRTSLSPGQDAAIKSRRVRLIHAAVRWLLSAIEKRSPRHPLVMSGFDQFTVWERRMIEVGEEEEHAEGETKPKCKGGPLNQEDLLATLGTFTTVTFQALDKMAISFDDDDREAYYHLWNVVGWHLGIGATSAVDELDLREAPWTGNQILPLSVLEMDCQYERFRQRLLRRSEQGCRLAKALVQELAYPLPNAMSDAPCFLVRYFIGDERANDLEIEEGGYAQVLIRRSDLLQWATRRLRKSKVGELSVSLLSQMVTRYALRAFVSQARSSEGGFAIGPQIASRWGIQLPPERQMTSV